MAAINKQDQETTKSRGVIIVVAGCPDCKQIGEITNVLVDVVEKGCIATKRLAKAVTNLNKHPVLKIDPMIDNDISRYGSNDYKGRKPKRRNYSDE